jgi:hypothetical protein
VTRERDAVVQGIEIENDIDVIVPIPILRTKVVEVAVEVIHVVSVLLLDTIYKDAKHKLSKSLSLRFMNLWMEIVLLFLPL